MRSPSFACCTIGRLLLLLFLVVKQTHAFAIKRKHIAGIWKLQLDDASAAFANKNENKSNKEILLKMQGDGSFQQCNDDTGKDNWLCGCWQFQDSELKLALDRKCSSRDILLTGKIHSSSSSSSSLSIQSGTVQAGKFMYPPTHAAFFENCMAATESTGKFSLEQVMGFQTIMMPSAAMSSAASTEPKDEHGTKKAQQFTVCDFFDRKFFMTVVPIEAKVKPPREWDEKMKEWKSPMENQPFDIRTIPIQFFANSTFEAIGVNKILRGRFEVAKENQLLFRVSRFGMGRSVKGSVYSEGIGLSHEDERTYIGSIKEEEQRTNSGNNIQQKALRIDGKVTFGTDLGSDARPEPVGTFIMREVDDTSLEMIDDMDSETFDTMTDGDIFDSVFE